MWMKDTRATRILSTVFNKHKYITIPEVTPEDRVIAASAKLADNFKGCMTTHLRETILDQLELIGTSLNNGWAQKNQQHPPRNPPTPPPIQNHKMQVPLLQTVGVGLHVPRQVSTPPAVLTSSRVSVTCNPSDLTKDNISKGGATSKGGAIPKGITASDAEAITPTDGSMQ